MLRQLGAVSIFALAAAAGAEPVPLTITGPSQLPVGFAGTELVIPMRLRNGGAVSLAADLSSRLYQRSSATLQPLAEAQPWWHGTVEPGQELSVPLKVALPAFAAATALRVRLLEGERKLPSYADALAIPRDWLAAELRTLGQPLALYAPDAAYLRVFADAGIAVERVSSPEPGALGPGRLLVLIPSPSEEANLPPLIARLARAKVAVAVFPEHPLATLRGAIGSAADCRELPSSAGAQYRFVATLRQALATPVPPP